jgi:hypothetical protein
VQEKKDTPINSDKNVAWLDSDQYVSGRMKYYLRCLRALGKDRNRKNVNSKYINEMLANNNFNLKRLESNLRLLISAVEIFARPVGLELRHPARCDSDSDEFYALMSASGDIVASFEGLLPAVDWLKAWRESETLNAVCSGPHGASNKAVSTVRL